VLVGHTLVQLEVWSRWGEKIFDSLVDGSNTWDGTINGLSAPSDVYVYRMRVRLKDGKEMVDKGEVTLLR
jgi:gliding motility-associated-like protein